MALQTEAFFFWWVLESIIKFIIELHVLQCLFVRGYNKIQWRDTIISNFTKGETLRALWDNLAMWCPFLHPSKKGLSSSYSLGKKRIYLEAELEGEFTDLFWKLPGYSLFLHRQSRQRMMINLLINKINLTCKRLPMFYLSGRKTETWLISPTCR